MLLWCVFFFRHSSVFGLKHDTLFFCYLRCRGGTTRCAVRTRGPSNLGAGLHRCSWCWCPTPTLLQTTLGTTIRSGTVLLAARPSRAQGAVNSSPLAGTWNRCRVSVVACTAAASCQLPRRDQEDGSIRVRDPTSFDDGDRTLVSPV